MRARLTRAGLALLLVAGSLPAVSAHAAATLNVPSNAFPTIQSAVAAASNGDTVLVAPGTYHENVDFLGKAITLESSAGAASTIIDGSNSGTVVSFHSGEGSGSVLDGFTIQDGNADDQPTAPGMYEGGGVYVGYLTSPVIENNLITNNVAAQNGGGISVYSASPLIENNTISSNKAGADGWTGGIFGGGIEIRGSGDAQVIGNTISNNTALADGGGIALFASGTPLIEDNRISGNSALDTASGEGGGLWSVNQSDASVVQNRITGNSALTGGGVYWSVPGSTRGPQFVNDTIAENTGDGALYLAGDDAQSQYYNTIVSGSSGTAILCDATYGQVPAFDHVDGYAGSSGTAWSADCGAAAAGPGDTAVDPALTTDFHLTATSPDVDAGDNSAPALPGADLQGGPRIVNGTVDLGAYEFGPPVGTLSPASVAFGDVPGGTTASQTVTLANAGNAAMYVSADSVSGSGFGEGLDGCLDQSLAVGASCAITVTFYAGGPGAFSGSLSVTDTAGTQTAALSATGVSGRPSFSPTSLAFGSVKVGKSGGSKSVVVTNVGNATLHVGTLSVQGADAGDFKITSTSCSGAALAPGATCSFTVLFKPTATGSRTAYVSFPCDDVVSTYQVPLGGTGVRG